MNPSRQLEASVDGNVLKGRAKAWEPMSMKAQRSGKPTRQDGLMSGASSHDEVKRTLLGHGSSGCKRMDMAMTRSILVTPRREPRSTELTRCPVTKTVTLGHAFITMARRQSKETRSTPLKSCTQKGAIGGKLSILVWVTSHPWGTAGARITDERDAGSPLGDTHDSQVYARLETSTEPSS